MKWQKLETKEDMYSVHENIQCLAKEKNRKSHGISQLENFCTKTKLGT